MSDSCPLQWQADSSPLRHQGVPALGFLLLLLLYQAFSSWGEQGLCFTALSRLLLLRSTGSGCMGFSLVAWALLLHILCNLPRSGIEPMSPALSDGFLSTAPPRKSLNVKFKEQRRRGHTYIATLKMWVVSGVQKMASSQGVANLEASENSVQFSRSVVSNSLWPHELQHPRPPCPSPTPRTCSNSCPSSWWCHPTISSSVVPFSSRLQSFPASGSFQMSQPFASDGQSIGASASASVLPVNSQDWFPLGLTGWISLLSKGLSRVFSRTTVQNQFFGVQVYL